MTSRRSKSILSKRLPDDTPSDSKSATAEPSRFRGKRHSVNVKARKRVIEIAQVPLTGRVIKGRPKPEQQRTKGKVSACPELRVSPSLKGPFRPVRALNLNRPGHEDGEQMSIQEFDRMQEGFTSNVHDKYYTNQEQVSKFLDKARAKNRKQDRCFPAGPVFMTKNSDSNVSVQQFLDSVLVPDASQPTKNTMLQKLHVQQQRTYSPFSPIEAPSPLQRMDHNQFRRRKLSQQPSSHLADKQAHQDMHSKLKQEQKLLERKLQGMSEMPFLEEFCSTRSQVVPSNMPSRQKTFASPVNQSMQKERKQFRPIQICAAQPTARIPLQVQKMKLTESIEESKLQQKVKNKSPVGALPQTLHPCVVNMPIIVNFEKPNTRAETGSSRRRLHSAVSNRMRTAAGRNNSVQTQKRQESKLSEAPVHPKPIFHELNVKTNMSVKEREPTSNKKKIASNFRTQTTMLRTLATPTSVQQQQSPTLLTQQQGIDGQYVTQTMLRSALENNSLRGEECLQTRKRLKSLMQLIERDLDKYVRSPISPNSPSTPVQGSRVPRIDTIKRKALTTRLDELDDSFIKYKSAFNQQQLPYVGLSKNKQNYTFKDKEIAPLLPLQFKQELPFEEMESAAIALPMKIEKIKKVKAFPFGLLLLDVFRNKLLEYPSQEPQSWLAPEHVNEIQSSQDVGSAILFTFLTFLHLTEGHSGTTKQHQVAEREMHDQRSEESASGTPNGVSPARSLQRVTSQSLVATRQPSINGIVIRSSSRSLTLLRRSVEKDRESETKCVLQEERSQGQENYKYQNKQSEEEKMLTRDAQMVVGVSYNHKLQQRSLPSAPNGNRVASSGEALFPITTEEFTPRGNRLEIKLGKFSSKTKTVSSQQRKDTRHSQKETITANNVRVEQQAQSRRNHFSIEKMPKVGSANGRNNHLSSSMQMLQAPSGSIESKTSSVVVNGFIQMNSKQGKVPTTQEKGFHLRYVSQGMQRSTSIDANQPKYLNSRGSAKGGAHRVNITQNTQTARDQQHLMLPTKTITDRVSAQQLHDKKAVTSVSSNQRRVGGVSSNNVVSSQQQNGLIPVQSGSKNEMKMQRSLHVQSNQSSIVVDNKNHIKKMAGVAVGSTMTFQSSEYGVMSSKQEQNRGKLPNEKITQGGDYEMSSKQKKNQAQITSLTSSTGKESKNVPLKVNSRKSVVIPSDYLIANVQENAKTTPIIKGSSGIGPQIITAETPNTVQSGKQPNGQGSFKAMPKHKNLISLSQQEKQGDALPTQRPQGRGDKISASKQAKQSNQSFQSLIQDGQIGGTFNKQNLERALKTAQMGVSQ